MACPYLAYRKSVEDQSFDEPRAYCEVVEQFVQPMRADICTDRYTLDHRSDCEFYLNAAAEDESIPSTSEDTEA